MMRGALAVLGQMAVAAVVAVVVAVVALIAIARVEWPAYNSSNQLHALTTVGQFGCLAGLLAVGLAVAARATAGCARRCALVFLSAFSVVTLAMPLGATKLYLFGISVDQQFRTEYLTRLTDTAALHDMTYFGLPPFYPPGWFWIGGRLAALTGTPGWEMFKPWAITSITIAVVVAFVLWAAHDPLRVRACRDDRDRGGDAGLRLAEPYAAIITVLLPPVLVLAWSGLRGRHAGRRLGRGRRRRALPRRRRAVLHAAAGLRRVHRDDHGAWSLARRPAQRSNRCCGWRSSRVDRRRPSR